MHARPSGLFITGTDTEVGKTILCASLIAAMCAGGLRVIAHKPIVTGLDEPAGDWPADHELLGSMCGMPAEQVSPLHYGPAVSPHLAAALSGEPAASSDVLARARAAAATAADDGAVLIVEGAGGLLAPLTDTLSMRSLAAELALPVLIAARPGLGTINHTLLSLEAARAASLDVRAVVLTAWPAEPSTMQLSNRETIERLGEVEVACIREVRGREDLLGAGDALPWRTWLA
jgi:dethiobiotin synthetase